jgi:CheY-like chemotaxis protein
MSTTMARAARREDDESGGSLQRAPRPSPAARRQRRKPVILIADDTTDVRELYELYFQSRGFIVVTATDGQAVIQVARDHVPDVIVMDLAMPQLDGITATRRIKSGGSTRQTRVILLTGYPQSVVAKDALEAGVDKLLNKPCLPEDLERHVNQLQAL